MSDAPKKCAHQCCTCIPPKGEKYCSTYCHDARAMTSLRCDCNHETCEGCGALGSRH